jgi:hypothetical protein
MMICIIAYIVVGSWLIYEAVQLIKEYKDGR